MTQEINYIPFIPTLHSGIGILTDFAEMAVYILRHIIANPGLANITTEHEITSLRELVFEYEQDPDILCGVLQKRLDDIYERVTAGYKYGRIIPRCYIKWKDEEQTQYDLHIELTGDTYDVNKNPVPFNITGLLSVVKSVTSGDKELKINFKGINKE